MSRPFDFTGLTRAQQDLLSQGGWSIGSDFVQPGPRTVAKLIERGLVVKRTVDDRSSGGPAWLTMRVDEYDVPWTVAEAWREHRARRTRPR